MAGPTRHCRGTSPPISAQPPFRSACVDSTTRCFASRWTGRCRSRQVIGWCSAILAGTPARIEGRGDVAAFFNGSAHSALAVFVGDRPAAAWYHLGRAKVVFDFEVAGGLVRQITFRAEPDLLAQVARRDGGGSAGGRAPAQTARP